MLIATVGVAWSLESTRDVVALCVGGLALGTVGLADDQFGLPALPRLCAQLLVPTVALPAIADVVSLWVPIAVILVAGYVNAFNFMDGINGISGLQAAVAGGFLALLASDLGASDLTVAGAAVAGAAIGFLPFNIVRARIFLGDVGSYFIGFWLSLLAVLLVRAGAPPLVVAAPFALYVLDTSTVLVRRASRGERLTEAHREHLYQRLVQAGLSHQVVAVVYAALTGVCSAMMYAVQDRSTETQFAMFAAVIVVLGGFFVVGGRFAGPVSDGRS